MNGARRQLYNVTLFSSKYLWRRTLNVNRCMSENTVWRGQGTTPIFSFSSRNWADSIDQSWDSETVKLSQNKINVWVWCTAEFKNNHGKLLWYFSSSARWPTYNDDDESTNLNHKLSVIVRDTMLRFIASLNTFQWVLFKQIDEVVMSITWRMRIQSILSNVCSAQIWIRHVQLATEIMNSLKILFECSK